MDDAEFQKLLDTPVPGATPRTDVAPATPTAEPSGGASLGGAWKSIGVGMAKAGFETYDWLVGEPAEQDKTQLRRDVEAAGEQLSRVSAVNAAIIPISQFVTGMLGAGKIKSAVTAAKPAWKAATRGAKIGSEVATAAVVGGVVFDPHEERLSNLIESSPVLSNPVTRYLAADPKDTAAEGRLKAMLESVGMDAALMGSLTLGLKAYRAMRSGDNAKARAAAREVETVTQAHEAETAKRQKSLTSEVDNYFSSSDTGEPVSLSEDAFDIIAALPPEAEELAFRARLAVPSEDFPEMTAEAMAAARLELKRLTDDLAARRTRGEALAQDNAPPRDWLRVGDVFNEEVSQAADPFIPSAKAAPGAPIASSGGRVRALPGEDVVPLLRGAMKDADALALHGSREAAIDAGHTFAGEGLIPWQRLHTPDDFNAFVGNLVELRRADIQKARGGNATGVLTDVEVNRLVQQRVAAWGDDPAQVRGILAEAGKGARSLAVASDTAYVLSTKAMDEADRVLRKMRFGNLTEWKGDSAAAMAEFVKRAGIAVELNAMGRAMVSNAARTLRRQRGDVGKITWAEIKKMRDMKPEALARLWEQANGDTRALRELLNRPGLLARTVDTANFILVNNLLWGWTTHAVNLVSNTYMLAVRPLERAIGSTIQGALPESVVGSHATVGNVAQASLKQYRFMVASLLDGARNAGRAFVEGDSILAPHAIEQFRVGQHAGGVSGNRIAFKPAESVGNIIHNALTLTKLGVGLPTRALGVADELSRQITYRSMVLADASVEAERRGLQGQAYKDFLRQKLSAAFDANGAATNTRAMQEASTVSFQQDLLRNTMGASLQNFATAHPWARQIVPFVQTPVNVLRTSVKMTPGLNLMQREYRDMIAGRLGVEAQAQALGQMSLGALYMGAAAALVDAGMFTGSGPSDPKVRRAMSAAGWKPNSIVTRGDGGTVKFFQLGRFDPVGMVFGIVADIMDILQHPDKRDTAGNLMVALGVALFSQVKERSYIRTLNNFLDALGDPEARGGALARQHASNLVPFSSALRNYGGPGMDLMREARSMTDAVLATLPGFAEGVPLRYDAFGEPIRIRRGPWSSIADDIVDREMVRMGLESGFTFPAPVPHHDGGDLRDITMEDGRNAYEVYQQYAGKLPGSKFTLKQILAKVIASPGYQRAPDGPISERGTRQYMLAGPAADHRAAAKRMLLRSKIVRDALAETSRKVRDAYIAKKINSDGRVERQRAEQQQQTLIETLVGAVAPR